MNVVIRECWSRFVSAGLAAGIHFIQTKTLVAVITLSVRKRNNYNFIVFGVLLQAPAAPASWKSNNAFVSGTGGLRFKSRANKIGHRVVTARQCCHANLQKRPLDSALTRRQLH